MIGDLWNPISTTIKLFLQKKRWKKRNKNNTVMPISLFDITKVSVGIGSYGYIDVHTFGNSDEKLVIGNYCSLTNGCTFILSGEHCIENIATYPFAKEKIEKNSGCKGPIEIEDDVWIGYGAIILSGVHIGQGAVIAAGAVVNKDVPPYAIAGGVPARVIKYRFDEKMRIELLKVDYGKLNKRMIETHIKDLYTPLKDIEQLGWMPKKTFHEFNHG